MFLLSSVSSVKCNNNLAIVRGLARNLQRKREREREREREQG